MAGTSKVGLKRFGNVVQLRFPKNRIAWLKNVATELDLRAPWVVRLIAVLVILILSMLII